MLYRLRLQHSDKSRVVNTFAVDGHLFHEFKPARENVGRIRQRRKPLLQFGHFPRGLFAVPTKTVCCNGAGGNGSEFNEVLWREENFIALP